MLTKQKKKQKYFTSQYKLKHRSVTAECLYSNTIDLLQIPSWRLTFTTVKRHILCGGPTKCEPDLIISGAGDVAAPAPVTDESRHFLGHSPCSR